MLPAPTRPRRGDEAAPHGGTNRTARPVEWLGLPALRCASLEFTWGAAGGPILARPRHRWALQLCGGVKDRTTDLDFVHVEMCRRCTRARSPRKGRVVDEVGRLFDGLRLDPWRP